MPPEYGPRYVGFTANDKCVLLRITLKKNSADSGSLKQFKGRLRAGTFCTHRLIVMSLTGRQAGSQSCASSGDSNMPKTIPPALGQKMASRAVLLYPANKRTKSLSKLLQEVENRIYHNETAARRARSMLNAVGALLQEMSALLDTADEERDGFSYVLFDFGKKKVNYVYAFTKINR